MYLITNRLRFLVKWYISIGIYAVLPLIIFGLLIFQENQILGCATSIFCIHFYRKDLLLIQLAYGGYHKLILLLEYFLFYLFYLIVGFFVKDPLILYSPLIFIFIICFLYFYESVFQFKILNCDSCKSIINKNDFIWRSGFRSSKIKFLLIYMFFISLMMGVKNIYIYSIFLLAIFFVVFNFYLPRIPQLYLDLIDNNIKKSILVLYKKNITSLLTVIIFPTILQVGLFYDNKLIIFSLLSFFICLLLIFQFLCVNIYSYRNNRSIAFIQLLNGLSIISVLIPPLGLLFGLYSCRLYRKLN